MLDECGLSFIGQLLMVACSKHHMSREVGDRKVVFSCRGTNMNNGTEESIISYCRWRLQRRQFCVKAALIHDRYSFGMSNILSHQGYKNLECFNMHYAF